MNVPPAIAQALKPFEPAPCAHWYTRPTESGPKCLDCGCIVDKPYIETPQERLQQECRS